MKWDHLHVLVHRKEDDKVDFVAKRETILPSIATHDTIEVHFNVTHKEWDSFLQRLKAEGWELEKVDSRDGENSETYYFRRAKE
jgi:hypothetical protein